MIDEHHEELASLYAFDLLEGADLVQFETALAQQPELQALVRELRTTSSKLAFASATTPPVALKERVLASVSGSSQHVARGANVIRPSLSVWNVVSWAAAVCFAVGALWLGQRLIDTRSEVAAFRDRNAQLDAALKNVQQELQAERNLKAQQLQAAQQQLGELTTRLADARAQLTERDRLISEGRTQLADRERQIGDRERQIAEARTQLGRQEQQVEALNQRLEARTLAAAEIERQLGDTKLQVAKLTAELESQVDLANLKITALASMLKNSPQALAVAVWDPKKQEGMLNVQSLPPLTANQDYQLWVVDPQYPNPVDAGVFSVEPTSGKARLQFKTKQPVSAINAFAVTRERKGGVPKAEGPFVLLGK